MRHVAAAAVPKDVGVLKKLKQSKGPTQQADPMYVASSEYLAQIGLLNLAEKSRVLDIATNPNSLFLGRAKNVRARPLDVDKDMRPVVDYLMSKGIKESGIVQVVIGYPPVLCMTTEILEGFWAYLESIGVQDVGAIVVERPTLLGLDVDTSLRKIVDYLKYVDTPVETIIKYLERSL